MTTLLSPHQMEKLLNEKMDLLHKYIYQIETEIMFSINELNQTDRLRLQESLKKISNSTDPSDISDCLLKIKKHNTNFTPNITLWLDTLFDVFETWTSILSSNKEEIKKKESCNEALLIDLSSTRDTDDGEDNESEVKLEVKKGQSIKVLCPNLEREGTPPQEEKQDLRYASAFLSLKENLNTKNIPSEEDDFLDELAFNILKKQMSDLYEKYKSNNPIYLPNNHVDKHIIFTHIISPGEFYIQGDEEQKALDDLTQNMSEYVCMKDFEHVEEPIIGEIYLYFYNEVWCRVKVLKKTSLDKYLVFLIDYGREESVKFNDLRKCLEIYSMKKIPALALLCSLYDLRPTGGIVWSSSSIRKFKEFTDSYSFELLIVKSLKKENVFEYEVDLKIRDANEHLVSIREILLFLGKAVYINLGQNDDAFHVLNDMFVDRAIEYSSKEVSIILSHFVSPIELYLQYPESIQRINDLAALVALLYNFDNLPANSEWKMSSPKVGMPCLANYSPHQTPLWRRGIIKEIVKEKVAKVHLIDYGRIKNISFKHLRNIPGPLKTIPVQGIKCRLDGFDDEAKVQINQDASDIVFAFKVKYKHDLSAVFINSDDKMGIPVVRIIGKSQEGSSILNDALVQVDVAKVTQKAIPKKKVAESFSDFVEMHRVNCMRASKRSMSLSKKSESVKSVDSVKYPTDVDDPEKNRYNKVIILDAGSPNEIHVRLSSVNDKYEEMKKLVASSINSTKMTAESLKIGSVCAVDIRPDMTLRYERVKVLKYENGKTVVQYIDMGGFAIFDDIDLIGLPKKLSSKGPLSFIVYLNSIGPVDGSDLWSEESCEFLKKEFERKPEWFMCRQGKFESYAPDYPPRLPVEMSSIENEIVGPFEPIKRVRRSLNAFLVDKGHANWLQNSAVSSIGKEKVPPIEQVKDIEKLMEYESIKWLPARPLVKSIYMVVPTYVNDDAEIFFQLEEDQRKIEFICNSHNHQNWDSVRVDTRMWRAGDSVVARYHLDKKWYRGTILRGDKNKNTVVVLFIDYGNPEVVGLEDIRYDIIKKDIPTLSYKGQLHGIVPTGKGKWSTKILDFIHHTIVNKNCKLQIIENNYPVSLQIKLYIIDIETDLGDLLTDQMKVCQRSITTRIDQYINDQSDEMFFLLPPLPLPMKAGHMTPIVVTHMDYEGPYKLFITPLVDPALVNSPQIVDVQFKYNAFINMINNRPDYSFQELGIDIKIGEIYLAFCVLQKSWFRIQVQEVLATSVSAFYIDIGSIDWIKKQFIRSCPPEGLKIPPRVMEVKLEGVNLEQELLNEETYSQLWECLSRPKSQIYADFVNASERRVRLLYEEKKGYHLIYQHLIDAGILKLQD